MTYIGTDLRVVKKKKEKKKKEEKKKNIFFNDTAATEIYTLTLHDALPISFDANRENGGSLPMLIVLPSAVHEVNLKVATPRNPNRTLVVQGMTLSQDGLKPVAQTVYQPTGTGWHQVVVRADSKDTLFQIGRAHV